MSDPTNPAQPLGLREPLDCLPPHDSRGDATRAAHARLRADDAALTLARARHAAADAAFDIALDQRVSMTELRRCDHELDEASIAYHDADNARSRSAELLITPGAAHDMVRN